MVDKCDDSDDDEINMFNRQEHNPEYAAFCNLKFPSREFHLNL